ncbi:hypothetical protein UPYG_G00154280 [Umbra pygmaea]|uniref:Bulb-type lectin domain-containing protein n=1 Tax=Umbra pygmaea TaxID=75934 RepID=A0ABD0XKC9_UMBPY
MSTNYMSANRIMWPGDYIQSNNGKFKAIFQDDGNFVVYTDGRAIWDSKTDKKGGIQLIMQADANLVIYTKDHPIWSTSTGGRGNANVLPCLRLKDDGTLVLTLGGGEIWKSK